MKPYYSESGITPIVLKDITKEELDEYFQFINNYSVKCAWTRAQAEVIGEAFGRELSTRNLLLNVIALAGIEGVPTAVLSAMIMGFQCGREFENRLMAKAMRGSLEREGSK